MEKHGVQGSGSSQTREQQSPKDATMNRTGGHNPERGLSSEPANLTSSHEASQSHLPGSHHDADFGGGSREGASTPRSRQKPSINVGETERMLSLGAGAILALAGLSRLRISGVFLTALGAAIAYRGFTGHCYMLEAMGLNHADEPGEREQSSPYKPAQPMASSGGANI